MNLKKLDDKDVVFLDEPWTDEELVHFRELLKKSKNRNFDKGLKVPVVATPVKAKKQVSAA
jgi:hypothetical protein